MPTLQITLKQGIMVANVPIAVEIVSSDLEVKWKAAIAIGQSATTESLEPGLYSVQANLPSGRRVTHVCDLREGEPGHVSIDVVGASPRENLEWATISKPTALAAPEQREAQLRSLWLRLWAREPDGRWGLRPWPTQMALRERGIVQYEFRFRGQRRFGQYYLQVGGPTMQWRLIALPADDIRVLITGAAVGEGRDEADSAIDVAIASMSQEAEVLLGYLSRGEIDGARVVTRDIIARRLLDEKRENPTAAAIAGYFLLVTRDINRLHQLCTSNLANSVTWLPDGAVIDAWYLIRLGVPADLVRARRRLIEAAMRGMPVYTRGLRLLLDGLASFDDDPDHGGPDIRAALKRVRQYAAAADWRSTITTFIGRDPNSPGKTAPGKPDDAEHVIFLTEVSEEDLAWKQRRSSQPGAMEAVPPGAVGRRPTVPQPDVEQARYVALGEAHEAVDAVDAVGTLSVSQDSGLFDEAAEQRFRAREAEQGEQLARLRSRQQADTPERTIARLLHVVNAQTQTEKLVDMNPVALLPEAEHPIHLRGMALERIVGTSDLLSVSFLDRGLVAAQTVGRVVVRDPQGRIRTYATGFLVSPRLFLTTHHGLRSAEEARVSVVEFNYQDGPDGQLLPTRRLPFDPEAFFVTSVELDFSLIAVGSPEGVYTFGWNHLNAEQGKVIIGEYLSVVQHADGAPKQIALREIQLIGIVENFLHCQSDTTAPSSGAPLFNDQWEVVGMHHAGIPMRDSNRLIMARGGALWTSEMGVYQIQWAGQEGVRVSGIVRFLRELTLLEPQARLREELLFLKPPAASD